MAVFDRYMYVIVREYIYNIYIRAVWETHLIPIGFVDAVHQRIVSYDPCSYGGFWTSTAPGIMIQQFEFQFHLSWIKIN